jgi:hypothetical protein
LAGLFAQTAAGFPSVVCDEFAPQHRRQRAPPLEARPHEACRRGLGCRVSHRNCTLIEMKHPELRRDKANSSGNERSMKEARPRAGQQPQRTAPRHPCDGGRAARRRPTPPGTRGGGTGTTKRNRSTRTATCGASTTATEQQQRRPHRLLLRGRALPVPRRHSDVDLRVEQHRATATAETHDGSV